MATITVLAPEVADRIAAGEVVQRPASVVKELVENSLDAGSRHIHVEIEGAGRTRISVSDDGCGMDKEDLERACVRHATSKIRTAADLDAIQTLGFRGEALASIAAVSRLSLAAHNQDTAGGWGIHLEGGRVSAATPQARQRGTTVEIRDLFYNTPARRKFLKSDATETFQIIRIVTELAMAHPDVAFTLRDTGKEIVRVEPAAMAERVKSILGGQASEVLVPAAFSSGPLTVSGLISKPGCGKPQRNHQYVFVNRRPVFDKIINHAITQAYQTMIKDKEFPIVALFICLPPACVDVNVHPHKREVRFRESGVVHDVLVAMIRQALSGAPGEALPDARAAGQPAFVAAQGGPGSEDAESRPYAGEMAEELLGAEVPAVSLFDRDPERPAAREPAPRFLQLADTFLVFSDGQGLRIIDQHAAHERILFEDLWRQCRRQGVERQKLLLPVVAELDQAHYELAVGLNEEFQALGFELAEFGGRSIAIHAYPAVLGSVALVPVFEAVLADLASEVSSFTVQARRERVLASLACHAAVRGHERLSPEQVAGLLQRLKENPVPDSCPHGRPYEILLSGEEIRRRFKRT